MSVTPSVVPLEKSLDTFCSSLSDILTYISPEEANENSWQVILEQLYNHLSSAASHDEALKKRILLPKLLVKNFDEEQIWQQIELLNGVLVDNVQQVIDEKLAEKVNSPEKVQSAPDVEEDDKGNEEGLDRVEEEDEIEEGVEEENDEEDEEEEGEGYEGKQVVGKGKGVNLADMDKFCEAIEKEVSEDEDSEEDEIEDSIFAAPCNDAEENEIESSLEKELKKMQKKIAAHEEEAMQPKSWKMMGESSTHNRDKNSLLEEHLQFDHGVRPAPEITIDTTTKIEKLLIERIKIKLWDDVERKEKPQTRDRMKQKELPLNQEKSQISLAEVYEKDYLAAQEAATGGTEQKEVINEAEEAIKNDLANLFRKLDALCNFAFTPKGAKEELKIVVNAPAISIEEAMPTAVAETQLLAPSEVKAKLKEELRVSLEETTTDKKRKRRKIKKSQSIKSNERELKKLRLDQKHGGRKVKSKKDVVSLVEDEVKQGITLAKKSSEKVNSNFFSKLQDSINQDAANADKPKKKKAVKSKNFNKFG